MSCVISIYHHIIHDIFAYVWHWCSFLCFALQMQINSYERETCFWKLEDGKGRLCALLFEFPWGEFGVSIPWPICQMLPKQWAIYLLLHLSTLKIWVVVQNKPEQNEQSKSTQWLQYTKLFVSLRASGMMHLHFVYPDHFLDAIHTWMTLNSLTS